MSPLVTIITPTYNHERYIGHCIQSVLAQNFSRWELIIVDDGSTDNTRHVVARYQDPRILLISQEHRGRYALADTYNRGLSMARGCLIAILEGDDFWPPDKLALQVPSFDDSSVVLAYGRVVEVNSRGRFIREHCNYRRLPRSVLENDPITSATIYMLQAWPGVFTFPCSVMIRRSALERIGGFRTAPGLPLVDYPTFLELSLLGRFRYIDNVLGFWRRHASAISCSEGVSRIMANMGRLALQFYALHRDVLVGCPRGLERKIKESWDSAVARHVCHEARIALYSKDWHRARQLFRDALRHPRLVYKLVSLAGLASTYAKLNLIEPLFKVARGRTIADFVGAAKDVDA